MRSEFSMRTRAANLEEMARAPLDVLVIGGGIVGSWIALTAALQGYRTGLVEKGDFAGGTSGKTSRLIHGGLRYLQQFRIGIVRQAARERDVLLRIAPRLVKPLSFLIPVYRERGPKGWQLRIGLWLYDALSREKVLPRRRWISKGETLRLEPRLDPSGLVRAALYSDAYAHDARLVLQVVKAAGDAGALIANYARVAELSRDGGVVRGARVQDTETGALRDVRASVVVNATGVWSEEFQSLGERVKLRPTKGIHLFVPRERIGHGRAVVLPTRDRRTVFVLPWGHLSLVGTTDTEYHGDLDRVEADPADVEYLLEAVNAGFPGANLTPADVVSTYAGLRSLVDTGEARESDISRKHEIIEDAEGLITVMGGKLTTARAMAEEVTLRVSRRVRATRRVDTKGRPLAKPLAGDVVSHLRRIGVDEDIAARLAEISASESAGAEGRWRADLTPRLVPGLPFCGLEVGYSARHEMAAHLDDVMIRRMGLAYLVQDHGLHIAPMVTDLLGQELGWDAARQASEMVRYRDLIQAMDRWREETGHG